MKEKKFSVLPVIYSLSKTMAIKLGMVLMDHFMAYQKKSNLLITHFIAATENQHSVDYKSLVGSTEFTINNGGNDWLEDIQFELQTSNWNDEKKFKIIVNGKTIVEKVLITFFQFFVTYILSLHKTQLKQSRNSFSETKSPFVTSKLSITKTLTWEIFDLMCVNRSIRAL